MTKLIHRCLLAAIFLVVGTECLAQQTTALNYVDPNIGTAHSRWFYYTPAAVPHGMAKPAPSTNGHYGNESGWEAVGYDSRHSSIAGFVQFHEFQIGGISLMPTTGPLKLAPGKLEAPDEGYRSRFKKEDETAEPGYYKVLLGDYDITAELTASKRVSYHRFTFPKNKNSRLVLDVGSEQGESGAVKDASVQMVDKNHFKGFVTTYPKYVQRYQPEGQVSMYIWGKVNKVPESVGAFSNEGKYPETTSIDGKGAGLYLEYQTKENETIEVKIGLSYTSTENARQNYLAEAENISFETAKKEAQDIWKQELNKIKVEGSSKENRVKFYTGLYHALLGRGVANDVDGSFPQNDGSVGRLPLNENGNPAFSFYNTDSIWGGFWNLTQLWALSWPERYNNFVQTHLKVYENSGWFGDGLANSRYVSGVGTNFVGLAIASAYNAGIRDYDIDKAYNAVLKNELGWKDRKAGAGKVDLKSFIQKGFVPYIGDQGFVTKPSGAKFSASHTLEYSFSSYAAAQMAKQLGKNEDYEKLLDNSTNWANLFDESAGFIRPKKADGSFLDNFDPFEPWRGFQEGNAWQYTFYVPHAPLSLIEKVGKSEFNDRLVQTFEQSEENGFSGTKEDMDAFSGLKYRYNHGNQPSLHISWLFNFSGKPWLTQKWTRKICQEFYGTGPMHGYGYGQDEDQGQLGGWYVLASLGLFDVKGFTDARPVIQFGSPMFDEAKINLGNENQLTIKTVNNSAENVYVQSITFNGKPLKKNWIYRDKLMEGGVLEFTMSNTPNKKRGINPPPTFSK